MPNRYTVKLPFVMDFPEIVLAERYKCGDKLVRFINSLTECLLVVW